MTDHDLSELILRLCDQPLEPRPTAAAPRLRPLKGIKGVLFDVYGTLLVSGTGDIAMHSLSTPAEALQEALATTGLASRGGPSSPVARRGVVLLADFIRDAHARRCSQGVDFPEVEIREIWTRVLTELAREGLLDPEVSEACRSERRLERLAIQYECRVNPVWPMPEVVPTLRELKRRGLVMGIVSNAQFYTPITLEALCGKSLSDLGFDPDFCSWSFEQLAAKPSVSVYAAVLDRWRESAGISARETLHVGNDMLKDVWAATRAGCRTALFAGDERSLRLHEDDPRVRNLEPDLVLTGLEQLPSCLT